ncbi:hypothetical protein [Mycolicibacterium sediminis]|uniref:Uncharacterized protein n=1 Tax=Mycolicibacterium sediminis TaxID=1286180 RepID=A0A7I7QK93_9MYCO|nr:hypothetical protein [Mycolicibacterium sediminis]BBY26685.1 hypothetical protein MSEDJ_07810 [Mycolicibacterium sediminis]
MTRLLAAGLLLVAIVEVAVLGVPDRSVIAWAGGAAAAVVLLGLRWYVVREVPDPVDESTSRDPAATLRRWLARTDTLVSRADSTRADWDKHLRPVLARQFELATGQRRSKDATSFHATARMVFGDELWIWVDPDAVATEGRDAPGPGREVLDELLRRLERI